MDLERLIALAREHLNQLDRERVIAEVRPSVRLRRLARAGRPGAVLGGAPHLPVTMEWPTWEGVPLDLLAQVDLAALRLVLPDGPLPESGHLLFFALGSLLGPHNELLGAITPASRPGWRVIYVPEDSQTLQRHQPEGRQPEQPTIRRVECTLLAEPSVPHWWTSQWMRPAGADGASAFEEARFREMGVPVHRIGGWADPTQSEPAEAVAIADAGLIDEKGGLHYQHPRAGALCASATEDWFLLLQLDTDDGSDGTGWMWGDAGVMFFYVRPEDSRRGDFSNVWMNWDCH